MRLTIASLLLLIAGCAPAVQISGGEEVDARYATAGGIWNDGAVITVAARLREEQGRVAVCGVWTVDEASTLTLFLHDRIVQAGSIRLGGQTLVNNLRYMPRVAHGPDLSGAGARCVLTEVAWEDAFADLGPEIRLPRQRLNGGRGSDEPQITFRQAPVPRLIADPI